MGDGADAIHLPPAGIVVNGHDAGRYETVVIHPMTGKPVLVKFALPVRAKRVFVERDRIEFRWGLLARKGMSVVFRADGGVEVE